MQLGDGRPGVGLGALGRVQRGVAELRYRDGASTRAPSARVWPNQRLTAAPAGQAACRPGHARGDRRPPPDANAEHGLRTPRRPAGKTSSVARGVGLASARGETQDVRRRVPGRARRSRPCGRRVARHQRHRGVSRRKPGAPANEPGLPAPCGSSARSPRGRPRSSALRLVSGIREGGEPGQAGTGSTSRGGRRRCRSRRRRPSQPACRRSSTRRPPTRRGR